MRSMLRSVLCALTVVCALGTVVAASASAAETPEFSTRPNSFKGTFGHVFALEGLEEVSYEKGTIVGELSGASTMKNVTISLLEGSGACYTENVEGKHGTTTFKALNARLGYIDKPVKEVGLMFEPVKEPDAECHGAFGGSAYTGVFITHITPVSTAAKKFQLTFRLECTPYCQQNPLLFEGESKTTSNKRLEVWGYPASIEAKGEVEFESSTEIKVAPAVVTEAASPVEPTCATLNGTVNPEGSATKYHFEYGTTTGYGSSTAEGNAGGAWVPVPESAKVCGLTAGATYHFRIVASNTPGTSPGNDMTFTTGAPTLQPAKGGSAFPVAFTPSGGEMKWHLEGTEIKCPGETGSGEFTSVKEGKVTLKFTGCKNGGKWCGKEGALETKELKTQLEYTYPAKSGSEGRETGLVLSPVSGEVFAEFFCEVAGSISVKGSIVAPVAPLQKQTKTLSLTIKQSGWVQEPDEYETESGEKIKAVLTGKLGSGVLRPTGMEQVSPTLALTGEEASIEQ